MSEKRKSNELASEICQTNSKKSKNGINLSTTDGGIGRSPQTSSPKGVVIKLDTSKPKEKIQPKIVETDKKLKQIFNADDDDDFVEEVMPETARMKMRNVGRDTPTSSGPNSFSKGKRGFVDIRKIAEKKLDELTKQLGDEHS